MRFELFIAAKHLLKGKRHGFVSLISFISVLGVAVGVMALIGEPNPERPGSELVKAYIQRSADFSFDGSDDDLRADITDFAKKHCSPYEVPKRIEFIEEMPLTAVGKIDKKVLRK